MPILKSSPRELAIHGGGPPTFESKLPVFSANTGDGKRFAALAERLFSGEEPGRVAQEFESALSDWTGVRNVVGFSSMTAAARCLSRCIQADRVCAPTYGYGLGGSQTIFIDVELETFGIDPAQTARALAESHAVVLATHVLGRPCQVQPLEDVCGEWDLPVVFFGHQALGARYQASRLGGFGRAEVFGLGRDQLIHASDSAIVTTDDDLLAHRLRVARAQKFEGLEQAMGDAAAAMGIANLESADRFVAANRVRYERYRGALAGIPGISLVEQGESSTCQSIAVQVDPSTSGLTPDGLFHALCSENIGAGRPFGVAGGGLVGSHLGATLLQLPAGPAATEPAIDAVCRIVELAVKRSLESPDPIRLAA